MDVGNAEVKHQKTLEAYLRRMDQLTALAYSDGTKGREIHDARNNVRETWARFQAAHHELTQACLEKMGW